MSTLRFLFHEDRRILRADFAELAPPLASLAHAEALRVIQAEPTASIRLLVVPSRKFSSGTFVSGKRLLVESLPRVVATAVVGPDGFREVVVDAAKVQAPSVAAARLRTFADERSALAWLAEQ
jgi:hypothetical protein